MEIEIVLSCCFCQEEHRTKLKFPDGWAERYDNISSENGFCPQHSKVAEFANEQCPGCVGGWGDCNMWSSFAYKGRRDLSGNDFLILATGVCPKRTNGTFSFDSNSRKLETHNISDIATKESGAAFAAAIKEYWERYPE